MKFDFLSIILDLFSMLLALLPFFLVLAPIIILIFCIKKKVRIKFRTFKTKGFRPERGNFGVYTYCGKQGKGKTYSLVEYLIDNKDNIVIFNNVADVKGLDYFHFTGFKELIFIKEIIDFKGDDTSLLSFILDRFDENRSKHIFNLLKDLKQNKKQLIITYDEIFTELLRSSTLAKPVMDFLCQMRKRKIIFLTTCQEWAELPLTYRRFCRYQIDCDMKPFLWTGFLIKTFHDAENMKWSNEEQEHIAPIVETTITKCRKSIADSYDTFLRISSVQLVSTSGSNAQTVENSSKNGQILSFLSKE